MLLVFLFTTFVLKGQEYHTKSIGIGYKNTVSLLDTYRNGTRIPDNFATTPYLSFSLKRYEIMLGVDIYRGQHVYRNYFENKIYGFQLNYKYYLFKTNRNFNLYAACVLKYIQYRRGSSDAVHYNYSSNEPGYTEYDLFSNKSFINTFGIGLRFTFLKIVGLHFSINGGYNYYESNYLPLNNTMNGGNFVGNKTAPAVFADLGLSFRLWKEKN